MENVMAEEIVDLLDETGKKLGKIKKSLAQQNGAWHRVVHIWILNSKGQLLIQKRSKEKSFFPNAWDVTVGGHVGLGEASIVSCRREMEEELGLKLNENKFEFLFSFADQMTYKNMVVNEIADVYLVKMDLEIKDLKFQKEEVSTAKWISKEEFFERCFSKDFVPHIKGYEKLREFLQ